MTVLLFFKAVPGYPNSQGRWKPLREKMEMFREQNQHQFYLCFYVLLPYIIYVMQSGRFSQYPADGKRAG